MRVLLDINVILDAMLQRAPWQQDADAVIQAAKLGLIVCSTTAHSLPTIFYVGKKALGRAAARTEVRTYLTAFEIISIGKQTLLDADALSGPDFEDDIVIAAAVASAQDAIVTRNTSDFAHSPILVLTPPELLKRIQMLIPPPATANVPP